MPVPPKQTKEIHGVAVTQIQLQGKWYTGVDGRVKIAEHADPSLIRREGAGYNVLSVQFVQIGDKWAYHCMVEYPTGSGVVKPGTDFIDMKDVSGVAKAESSAIGRALGLHGIAIEESIASAEEMSRVEPDETPATQHAPPSTHGGNPAAQTKHATPAPQDAPAASQRATAHDAQDTPAEMARRAGFPGGPPVQPDPRQGEPQASAQQLASIHTLCNALGRVTPTEPMTYAEARQLIGRLNGEYRDKRAKEGAR